MEYFAFIKIGIRQKIRVQMEAFWFDFQLLRLTQKSCEKDLTSYFGGIVRGDQYWSMVAKKKKLGEFW